MRDQLADLIQCAIDYIDIGRKDGHIEAAITEQSILNVVSACGAAQEGQHALRSSAAFRDPVRSTSPRQKSFP